VECNRLEMRVQLVNAKVEAGFRVARTVRAARPHRSPKRKTLPGAVQRIKNAAGFLPGHAWSGRPGHFWLF